LIRASISDENANLSMEDEGLRGTVLSIAQAAKNSIRIAKIIQK
jgi:propionate CoA-transferase